MTLDQWRARYEELHAEAARLREERDAARAEAAELQSLFDLQRTRMDAARALWQDAHLEKKNFWPDLGDLLKWLMDERAAAKTVSQLDRAALAAAREERDAAQAYAARAGGARAVEALEAIRSHLDAKVQQHEDEVSNDFSSGESHGWRMALWQVLEMSKKVNAQPALDWLAQVKRKAAAEALQAVKARLYAWASKEADQPYGHAMNPRQWAATRLECAAEVVTAMQSELEAAALREGKDA